MNAQQEQIALTHGQEIRIKGFSRLANQITVGTARGYALEYGEDGEAAHARALKNGHPTAFANQAAGVLTSDYPGKEEELRKAKEATAAAPEIENGQTVQIEGELFIVRVTGERFADPVHFTRVSA